MGKLPISFFTFSTTEVNDLGSPGPLDKSKPDSSKDKISSASVLGLIKTEVGDSSSALPTSIESILFLLKNLPVPSVA